MNQLTVREAYEKWADDLVGYATVVAGREHAHDVVAETFATVLRNERTATGQGRPSPWSTIREPRAYLFTSVLNTARKLHRTTSRRSAREAREHAARGGRDTMWGRPAPAPDSPLIDPTVVAAVRSLSAGQRAAIYLTYWDDLGLDDVAEILGCSRGAVKRQLARARATLRNALGRKEFA